MFCANSASDCKTYSERFNFVVFNKNKIMIFTKLGFPNDSTLSKEKRYTYGTVMIDLKNHRVIDILDFRGTNGQSRRLVKILFQSSGYFTGCCIVLCFCSG